MTWTIERCQKETEHAQVANSHFCRCTHVMYDSEKRSAIPMSTDTKAVQHTAELPGHGFCICGHSRANHSSDNYDLTHDLGYCLDEDCGCEVFWASLTESRARLIAAAPELLAELEETGAMLESILVHVSHGGPTRADGEAALKRIQYLVRKAKGEL